MKNKNDPVTQSNSKKPNMPKKSQLDSIFHHFMENKRNPHKKIENFKTPKC
jgi:hypothetical protein